MRKIRGNTWSVDDIEESQLSDQRAGFQEEREGLLGMGQLKEMECWGGPGDLSNSSSSAENSWFNVSRSGLSRGGRGNLFAPALTILFYLICGGLV